MALRNVCLGVITPAILLCGVFLTQPVQAEPPQAERAHTFVDGRHHVDVKRLNSVPDINGLTPIVLSYQGRAESINAWVDHTAIVTLEPGAEPNFEKLGAKTIRPLMKSAGLWLVEDTVGGDGVDVAERLRTQAFVRGAVPNLYLRRVAFGSHTPNDPRFSGQWYFSNLKMEEAWGRTLGEASTTIVVVDTGCDMNHPDLVSKLDQGLDVVDGDNDPSPVITEQAASHGTSCAGLVGAATDNSEGIAGGCPNCRVRCVRLLSDAPVPTSADVDAFQFALDVNASVVSNSWGFVDPIPVPAALEIAINNVFDNGRDGKGALVLFAMGNDDREVGDEELEAVRGVLGIGAINNFDEQTPFTNSGNCVDLVAPTGTLTTDLSGAAGEDPGDYTSLFGGTSSACPVAAGIAGLLVSVAPDRTSQELYDILIKSARPAPYATPDAMGHDMVFGYGIIDPVKALDEVLPTDTPDAGVDAGTAGKAGNPSNNGGDAGTSQGGSAGNDNGGSSNGGSAGHSATTGNTPNATPPEAEDSGCACEVVTSRRISTPLLISAGLLTLLGIKRRSRKDLTNR